MSNQQNPYDNEQGTDAWWIQQGPVEVERLGSFRVSLRVFVLEQGLLGALLPYLSIIGGGHWYDTFMGPSSSNAERGVTSHSGGMTDEIGVESVEKLVKSGKNEKRHILESVYLRLSDPGMHCEYGRLIIESVFSTRPESGEWRDAPWMTKIQKYDRRSAAPDWLPKPPAPTLSLSHTTLSRNSLHNQPTIFLFILFLGTILESITFDSAFTVVTVINSVNPAHTQTTQEFGFKLGLYSKGPVHTLSTLISKRFNGDVNLNRPLDKTVNYDHDMADVTPGGLGYSGTMPVSDQLAMALPPHDHEGDGVSQIKERLASKAPSPKTRSLDDSVYKQVQGGFERGYDEGTGIEAEIYDGQALVTDEQVVGLEVVVDDESKPKKDHHDGLEDGQSDETVRFIIGNGIITQEAYNEIIEISIPQALAEGVYLVEEDEYQPIEAHLDDGSDMQLDETVHHLANKPRVLISFKPSEAIQSGHNGRIIPWTLVVDVCLVDDDEDRSIDKDLDKLDMESDKTTPELFDQTSVLTVESSEATGQDERDRTVAVFIPWTLTDGVCLVGEGLFDKRDMPLDETPRNLSLQSAIGYQSADDVPATSSEPATAISAVTSLAATPTGTLIGTSNTSDIISSLALFLGDSPSVFGEDIGRDLESTSDSNQTHWIGEQPLDYQPMTTTNTTTDSVAPLGTNSDDELALNITTMATTKKFNFNFMELIAYFTQGEQPRAVAPLDSRTRRKILFQCIFSLVIAALVQLPTPPQQWVEFIRRHPFSTAAATLPLDQFDIQQWFINIKNTLEHENFFGFGLLSVIVVTDEQVVGLEVVVDDESKPKKDHHDGLEDGQSDETVRFIIGNGIITQEAYNEIIEISIPQALAEGVYLVEEDEYQPIEAHLDDELDMQLDETVHHLAHQPRVLISVKPSEASGHNGRIRLAIPWTLVDGVCLVDDNVMEKDLDKLDMESDKTTPELFDQTSVLTVESSEATGQDERDRTVAVFIPWTLTDGVCLVGEGLFDKRDMPLDETPRNLSLQSAIGYQSADDVPATSSEPATAISAVTSLAATPTGTLIGTSNTSDIISSLALFLGDSPSVFGEDIGRDLESTSDSNQTHWIGEQPLDYQPMTTTNTTTDSVAPLGTNSDDELALNITTMATTKKFNFNFMELIAYFTQGEQPRAVAPLDSRTRRKILFQCIFSLIIAALVQLPTPPQQWVEFIRQHPFSTAAATLPLDQFDIQQWFINIKNTLEHENFFGFGLLSVIVVAVIVVVLENIWAIYVLYCFVVAGIFVPGYLGLGLALGEYRGLRYPFGDFEAPVVDEDGEEEVQEEVTLVEEELMEEAQDKCTTEAKDFEEASSEVQPKEAQARTPEVQEEISPESTVRVGQVQVQPRFKPLLAIEDNKHKTTFKDNRHQIDAQLDARWKRLVENATNSGFNDQDAESSGKKKKPNFNWSTKMAVPEPCNIYMRPVKFVERTMTPADEKKGEKVRFVFRPNKYDVAMGRLDDDGWFNVTMGKDEISMPKIHRGHDWIRCYWIGKR
ncbi:hypothetical protein BDN72DRAFT_862690 [Pluteus cervinus]|uniref:Uncharacterized protein n=1 Tax=Pluteus cervinus TaxID=181527 RepID=A0ACD3AB38_9AGAR|nr:hypothetical protein BDN72DRAFT_862690 [Pluteus cervinus]